MRTALEFATAAMEHNITWWPIRDCSICGCPIGYLMDSGQVAFRSACGCSSFNGITPRTWEDVAAHYNRQTHPRAIAAYDKFWRFEPEVSG